MLDALDGLPPGEFEEWAWTMLSTSRAWMDAYEGYGSKRVELVSAGAESLATGQ